MIRKHFVLLSALMVTMAVYAEGSVAPTPDYTVIKRKYPYDPKNPNRSKIPGLDRYLQVTFYNGTLAVEFPEYAESGVVTIGTGAFDVFTATIDRSCNKVELPSLSGEFLLTVTFDNGDVYEGEISL